MKKIATILVLIFFLVQVMPVVSSLFSLQTVAFMVDEEKIPEKTDTAETKDPKNFVVTYNSYNEKISQKINTAFHLAEKIELSPCLEKLTPPPNFS